MPAPEKSLLIEMTKTNFISKQIKLPIDWEDPGEQFPDAFDHRERQVAPNPPTTLFCSQTQNRYHVETARRMSEQFTAYIEGICGAICDGIGKWMKLTAIKGVVINGSVGALAPGGVTGPPLTPLIMETAPKSRPQEARYSNAIANAIGTSWQAWSVGLTGTITFPPSFSACSAPAHPPTPNIPQSLITLSSAGEAGLSAGNLKSVMIANLADATALHAGDLFDSIAKAFANAFQTFKATTIIQNVIGTGPVPTYSFFTPVGPVVGGVGNGIGCLT